MWPTFVDVRVVQDVSDFRAGLSSCRNSDCCFFILSRAAFRSSRATRVL